METCYRILGVINWIVAVGGGLSLILFFARGPALAAGNPLYWFLWVTVGLLLVAGIFRGWPFPVRFAILVLALLSITVCAAIEIGLSPNWSFFLLFLICSSSLFYGVRAGLLMVVVLTVTHFVVAWGWVTGRFPLFMSSTAISQHFLDFRSPLVWVRVLVTSVFLQTGMVLLLRYVLGDLNGALRQANQLLQKLAVEQEYRARAEEGRLKAELAVREAQKFEALGRMASGVAHDFNNALCVMKGWSSLLLEDTKDPLVQDAMRDIKRAGDSAEQLTQHLLAFSRSEPLKVEVVNLSEAVELEARTLRRLLPPDVQVLTTTVGQLPVYLGRGQLQEVMLNLAINARDAMPHGGRLTIAVAAEERRESEPGRPAGRYARLDVVDSGIGMDPATQARIFEPFFTTKEPGKGTGLGLAMVYGVVTGAGGWISVDSRVGYGTTFSIRLPVVDATAVPAQPTVAKISNPKRCRVLVVESSAAVRSLVERILSREGFPVVVAATGTEALAALAGPGGFGLLVIEAVTAGTPVTEVIQRSVAVDPSCRVIVAATQVADEALQGAIRSGLHGRLTKPFDAGQLREAVNEALGRQPVVEPAK